MPTLTPGYAYAYAYACAYAHACAYSSIHLHPPVQLSASDPYPPSVAAATHSAHVPCGFASVIYNFIFNNKNPN